jgi:hypothetical protein
VNKKIVLGTSGPPAYRGLKYDVIFLLLTKLSLNIHKVLEGLRSPNRRLIIEAMTAALSI